MYLSEVMILRRGLYVGSFWTCVFRSEPEGYNKFFLRLLKIIWLSNCVKELNLEGIVYN